MNNNVFHESSSRGTPDFPLEPYFLDESHPRYNMQFHWHNEYELINIHSGKLELWLNDKPFTLKEGESVFIPGGFMHGASPSNCKYECIVFYPSIMFSTQKSRVLLESQIISPVFFENEDLIENIFEALRTLNRGYEFVVTGNLYLLAEKMLVKKSENKILPNLKIEKIKAALNYIEKNYMDKILLSELSKISGMNPNYFCRFFKELTQQTPMTYITRYRIEKSCEFLISGLSVTDTAYQCGFNDTSYFINIFKKHMGISPKKYQHSHGKI